MTELVNQHCVPCEGGLKPFEPAKAAEYLKKIQNWKLTEEGKTIKREFSFKNFYHTMGFVNAVAYIANQEGHHPDIELGYNYCHIRFTTHAINGLSENDFICAAKVDMLLQK